MAETQRKIFVTDDGRVDVTVYDDTRGKFVSDLSYHNRIFSLSWANDVDRVSKETFDEQTKALREERR